MLRSASFAYAVLLSLGLLQAHSPAPPDILDGAVEDLSGGDGGVLKKVLRTGHGRTAIDGSRLHVRYIGTLADGYVFDQSAQGTPFSFNLGRLVTVHLSSRLLTLLSVARHYAHLLPGLGSGEVIKGWDIAFASMTEGEIANLTIAHDYGYGTAGLPPRITPYASLCFEVELLSTEAQTEAHQHTPTAPLELPDAAKAAKSAGDGDSMESDVLVVGGNPVKVDRLGPIVVNKDGSLSRITNWLEMSKGEQQKTLLVVAKRNKKRMRQLESEGATAVNAASGDSSKIVAGASATSSGSRGVTEEAAGCASSPCQHGSECYSLPVVSCVCAEGFSGSHCETSVTAAAANSGDGASTQGQYEHPRERNRVL